MNMPEIETIAAPPATVVALTSPSAVADSSERNDRNRRNRSNQECDMFSGNRAINPQMPVVRCNLAGFTGRVSGHGSIARPLTSHMAADDLSAEAAQRLTRRMAATNLGISFSSGCRERSLVCQAVVGERYNGLAIDSTGHLCASLCDIYSYNRGVSG